MWHRLTPSHLPGLRLFHKQAGRHHLLAEGNHPGDLTSIPIRVTDDEALAFARQLPEVKAVVTAAQDAQQHLCFFCEAAKQNGGACPGHCPDVVALDAALKPFQEAADD